MNWQQRVIVEKAELDKRIGKLIEFQSTLAHSELAGTDQSLLSRQRTYMVDYSNVLDLRIARF